MLERKRKRTPKSTIVFSEHTARLASVTPHQFGQWIVFPIFLKLIINKKIKFSAYQGRRCPFCPSDPHLRCLWSDDFVAW